MNGEKNGHYTKWRNHTLNAQMHTDKKYLILKMGSYLIATAGLGWYVLYTLHGIRFAVENGYIPVVDWQNCKLPQYDAAKVGKENVWEYFFEQPLGVTVEQAYESGDFFVIDDVRKFDYEKWLDVECLQDFHDREIGVWREYFQKYIRIKKDLKESFDRYAAGQKTKTDNFIGVLARGTDYAKLKPVGHLKPIPVEEIFSCIDIQKEKKDIFLATEDQDIFKVFEDKYPGRIHSAEARRYDLSGYYTLNTIYREENGYERDRNYLYSLYIVSKCAKGIYSACGGGVMASLMREKVGESYRYLCHGHNRPKAIIIGSFIERQQEKMIFLAGKPLMFYTLNILKLLSVEEADIIISQNIKLEYQKLIGDGRDYGIKFRYIVTDNYNPVEHIASGTIEVSRVILLYADYFVHGKDVIKELSDRINTFDGAWLWGVKTYFSDNTESINVDRKSGIPQDIKQYFQQENYSLVGKYVFDHNIKDIVKKVTEEKEQAFLSDVLDEYIARKQLFFSEYGRGIICSKIEDEITLDRTERVIRAMEEIQGQKIGDFESFRFNKT